MNNDKDISGTAIKNILSEDIFRTVCMVARRKHIQAFVIGGFVRDHYLGRPSCDIDIVVTGSGVETAEELAAELGVKVTVFRNFGTARLLYKGMEIELVGARKESYRADSRKPIVEDGTIEDDQDRRDFTINAMAWSLNENDYGRLIDPFGGMDDLKDKTIRTPSDPDRTFSDDPLRMIRAIRFATQLGFVIEQETFRSISRNRERIRIVSKERITTELNKIVSSPTPSRGFYMLKETGMLEIIFPELDGLSGVEKRGNYAHKDNFIHTLKVLDNVAEKSDDVWLRWAAILHDIGKPDTKQFDPATGWTFHGHEVVGSRMVPQIFRKLRLPMNDKMKFVRKMVFLHLRPIILSEDQVTDSAVRRLLFEAGDDIEPLMTLCEADITSGIESKVKKYLANFALVRQKLHEIEEKDRVRNFQPPVTGELIMATYGIGPCKAVGDIKSAIKEAILEGKIGNNYEEAYALMEQLAREEGLAKI